MLTTCRGCASADTRVVLDLGRVPAADYFPAADTAFDPGENAHALAMVLCGQCGLAQLAEDDTDTEEPRAVEPQALKDQAAEAVRTVSESGWINRGNVAEFSSPHGGSWLPLLTARGLSLAGTEQRASVVVDCFGIMHEPDQRAAIRLRADRTAPDGVLLLQFHSLEAIVTHGQWNALRHGHFAYYSLSALERLLADAGMSVRDAWEFDLYGGTILIVAQHGAGESTERVHHIIARERACGMLEQSTLARLQHIADDDRHSLREYLELQAGCRMYAYGAASRAVSLLSRAGITEELIAGVADASASKQSRRMPGTDIAIISPDELVEALPDAVLLMLPDLLPEVSRRYPQLTGKWVVDWRRPR